MVAFGSNDSRLRKGMSRALSSLSRSLLSPQKRVLHSAITLACRSHRSHRSQENVDAMVLRGASVEPFFHSVRGEAPGSKVLQSVFFLLHKPIRAFDNQRQMRIRRFWPKLCPCARQLCGLTVYLAELKMQQLSTLIESIPFWSSKPRETQIQEVELLRKYHEEFKAELGSLPPFEVKVLGYLTSLQIDHWLSVCENVHGRTAHHLSDHLWPCRYFCDRRISRASGWATCSGVIQLIVGTISQINRSWSW